MKAFLYARVSTGEQSVQMQLDEMLEWISRAKIEEFQIFQEIESGANDERPVLADMLIQVRRRKCDVVLVYKFDRLARSLRFLLNALEEFESLGVRFVSLHDDFDMTTAAGRLMFKMVGAFAEFERDLIRQRVKSGMAVAKKVLQETGRTPRGKTHIGRPALGLDEREIESLRAKGLTWYEIADAIGASESAVRKFMRKKAVQNVENSASENKGLAQA